jgi:transcriptional regulator with XRE-family HTH domain
MSISGEDLMCDGTRLAVRRNALKLTQSEMANRLGLSLRAYQDLEKSVDPIRPAYKLAVDMISMREAVRREDASLASEAALVHALHLAQLVPHVRVQPISPRRRP